ncbi:MAG: hypothetical protein OXD43_14220 [Bacteroidetes bacterium]|nr:hypothetical protein [Bacteroidota bacterium]
MITEIGRDLVCSGEQVLDIKVRMVHFDPEDGARWRLNSTREKSIPSSKDARL